MARNKIHQQWRQALFMVATCLTVSRGQELDTCASERNCTVQINSSASLLCTVGHGKECNNVKLTRNSSLRGTQDLYPYLATISIYKRSYGSDVQVDALNFSFVVPHTDGREDDIQGVMSEFGEAPGYRNNSYYKEPICRFFNFSSFSAVSPRTIGTQNKRDSVNEQKFDQKLEIPYNCIGIGIFPSVFQLNLMSVPSSHHLNYLVSWHEHPHGENAHFYDYYEDPGLKTEKVWAEQLIAVAVIDQDKLIHTVFQPPRSEAGVRFLNVSLTNQLKVVKFKQVELDETSVTFRDVLPGQYKVIISPHGGVCDIDPNLCRDISSECVSIGENSDVVTDNSTEGTLITVLLVSGVVIILVVLGVMALLIRWKYRKKRESVASAIFLTSMACRELEKHVTSYFCTFLSVALHTSVTFTLPLLHPDRSKVIDAGVTNHEVEARQSLVTQPLTLHKFFRCFIILKFSYATKKSGINSLIGKSDGNLSERSFYSQGNASYVLESILQKVPSKEVYFVTFKQECYSADTGIAYTIYEDSENGIISEDQITVLNDDAYHLSHSDDFSLCNRIDSYTSKNNHQNIKEYLLPSDINELYEDLRSQAYSKAMHLSNSEIIKIDYWLLAVTMFGKAAENQPGDNASDSMISDVGGDTETIPERDSIQDKQEKLNILPNYKRQYSYPPGFSLPHYQIHKNHSNKHFAVLPHALSAHQHNVVDSFPKITTDENDDLLRISQRCDTTAIETSADNHNSLILKSVPTIVNESLSSCDSYSNLTDAEKDIEFQIIQNQSKKNSEIKKMAESLAQGSHSFVCARTFISRGNTLHVDLPASRCQGQMQKKQ